MPEKYHIKAAAIPGRFRRVGKFGSVDWREDCSRCTNCVKPRCIYDTYKKEAAYNRDPSTSVVPLYECRGCLSCVQGCTKGLLGIALNPEYMALGDEYWRPDILATTWNQADNGRVPVSGAGYRGRFNGPGFDGIWTDMSEIVRPTRDGIHGREYISTAVDIGSKPMRLSFSPDGKLMGETTALLDIPVPLILQGAPWEIAGKALSKARLAAAKALKTLSVDSAAEVAGASADQLPHFVPLIGAEGLGAAEPLLRQVRMAEFVEGAQALDLVKKAKAINPALVCVLRMPMQAGVVERILAASKVGVKVFQLCADLHGREIGAENPRHLKDVLRGIHTSLVKAGMRDEVTLIVSGGIALAEHMAKTIICGADLIAVDTALLVALGCRVCRGATGKNHIEHCAAEADDLDPAYAAQRMVNLMSAWHSQLLEVLGAMGIREVRRLRGEVGRAIFMEDIEREAFGDLACK
ncbi:MAG TPA: glutamate synthase-related protein [Polyangia bacterium]